QPRIAPGYEQIWRPGNPNPRNRLLATLQTIRQTAVIDIHTGERGGYLVAITVMMEEEDLPRPSRVQTGAVFQEAPTVDRHLEVVGPAPVAPSGTTLPSSSICCSAFAAANRERAPPWGRGLNGEIFRIERRRLDGGTSHVAIDPRGIHPL